LPGRSSGAAPWGVLWGTPTGSSWCAAPTGGWLLSPLTLPILKHSDCLSCTAIGSTGIDAVAISPFPEGYAEYRARRLVVRRQQEVTEYIMPCRTAFTDEPVKRRSRLLARPSEAVYGNRTLRALAGAKGIHQQESVATCQATTRGVRRFRYRRLTRAG
jgi:hypothetical protein